MPGSHDSAIVAAPAPAFSAGGRRCGHAPRSPGALAAALIRQGHPPRRLRDCPLPMPRGAAAVPGPEVLFGPRKGAPACSEGQARERGSQVGAAEAPASEGGCGAGRSDRPGGGCRCHRNSGCNKPSPSRALVRPGHDGICKCDGENASDVHGRFHPECHRGPRAGRDSRLSSHTAMGYYGL